MMQIECSCIFAVATKFTFTAFVLDNHLFQFSTPFCNSFNQVLSTISVSPFLLHEYIVLLNIEGNVFHSETLYQLSYTGMCFIFRLGIYQLRLIFTCRNVFILASWYQLSQ